MDDRSERARRDRGKNEAMDETKTRRSTPRPSPGRIGAAHPPEGWLEALVRSADHENETGGGEPPAVLTKGERRPLPIRRKTVNEDPTR